MKLTFRRFAAKNWWLFLAASLGWVLIMIAVGIGPKHAGLLLAVLGLMLVTIANLELGGRTIEARNRRP